MKKFLLICPALLLSSLAATILAATIAFAQSPAAPPPVVPSAASVRSHPAKPLTADEKKYNDAVNLFIKATNDKDSAEIANDVSRLQTVEQIPEFKNDADVHNLLGYLYLVQNTPDSLSKAILELQTVLTLRPEDAAAHNNLGNAFQATDPPRYDEAAAQYKAVVDAQALRPPPSVPDPHSRILAVTRVKFTLATVLGQAGRLDEALAQFQELDDTLSPMLSSLQGEDQKFAVNVYKNYAYVAVKANQTPKAAAALTKAANLNPKDAGVWLSAGELYAQQGSQDEAVTALTKAVGPEVDPKLDTVRAYDAHFALAQAHVAKGETNQAINEFDLASQLEPQNAAPFYNKGVLQEQMRLKADAAASYRSALKNDPGDLQTQTALGMLLADQGSFAEAASLLSQVAPRMPQEQSEDRVKAAIVYARLADMQAKQKDYAGADHSRLQALALNPDDVTSRLILADAYVAQKQYVTALVQYDIAAKARPGDPVIQNQRGVIYEHLKQYPKALAAFKRALVLDPRNAQVQNNIGVVEELLHQPAAAIIAYKRALALDPKLVEARYNLSHIVYP